MRLYEIIDEPRLWYAKHMEVEGALLGNLILNAAARVATAAGKRNRATDRDSTSSQNGCAARRESQTSSWKRAKGFVLDGLSEKSPTFAVKIMFKLV